MPYVVSSLTCLASTLQLGAVADDASEALKDIRQQRQANTDALRTLMDTLARTMYEKGASDSRTVSIVRGRYCLALKVGSGPQDVCVGWLGVGAWGASRATAPDCWRCAVGPAVSNGAWVCSFKW
jgi:hypothetical protein